MTHSSSTSSSEKPTINSLCSNSSKPAAHKSAHATSLLLHSKAAMVPIASTRISGRSQLPAAKWTNSGNHSKLTSRPAPRITERKRFRQEACEAVKRRTFNISGSAPWIARTAAFANPSDFTNTAQQASSAARFNNNAAVSTSTWLSRDFTAFCNANVMRPGALLARLFLDRRSVVNWYNVLNSTFFEKPCWHAAWSFAGKAVCVQNVLRPRWSKERL
mmetsp:Transcript_73740/g.213607  ORF Transcript_73740/g.213607 Transcript_73740/m.213607 type:complete len:218 (+) Transcript_73740:752-1405(+)